MSFVLFLKNDILHFAPILVAAWVAISILLERLPALVWIYPLKSSKEFFSNLRYLIMADRTADALALCDKHKKKLVAQVVKVGILRAHQPEALIEDELELAVREAGQKVQRLTPFLATIANVATLLGLFGTILGLVASFKAVGSAATQEKSALLSAGISSAMNATMMGLAVAIPCMIAFSFLMNRSNHLLEELDQAALRTMALIRQRYYAAEVETTKTNSPAIKED